MLKETNGFLETKEGFNRGKHGDPDRWIWENQILAFNFKILERYEYLIV